MYSTEKIKTWQPVLEEGRKGPICFTPTDALFDIIHDIKEQYGPSLSDELVMAATMIFTGLIYDWIDGEYIVFDTYKLIIKHYNKGTLEEMVEFAGY